MSYWLQKQRKPELSSLAEHVGMKDYDALRKTDLEIALDDYLRQNQTKLSGDPKVEGFYKRIGSPVKRDSNASGGGGGAITSGDERPKGKPRKSIMKARDTEDATSDAEPQASTGLSSLIPRTPRTPSLSFAGHSLDLPTTPSQLANTISAQQSSLRASISRTYDQSFIPRLLNYTRQQASSVVAISLTVLAMEAYGLVPQVMPSRYLTTIPPIPALHTGAQAVHVPDLFALLTLGFWGPVGLWMITSIGLPLTGAWFFNLTRGESVVDPMSFSIFKALVAYIVYSKGGVGGESVDVVKGSVPAGVAGLLIGAGVGGLASLWESVLAR